MQELSLAHGQIAQQLQAAAPSTQVTPAVKAAGLPGSFVPGSAGRTPFSTPAAEAPATGTRLHEQVLVPQVACSLADVSS